ncbi:MoaD/ThiS family protein [Aureliella helgolandensis]|uniref:Molybdopterin synthase sulfur carrier subunit n=1 Tax=Aureliella helgolandensis TaxID=2527968 RepID=A0A518GDH9_9BACT|nr:MoaD/ThiS family protein [Aureliella helgolandensis]QDV26608.1 ThiS family protein [Aureliella helgolandensis]
MCKSVSIEVEFYAGAAAIVGERKIWVEFTQPASVSDVRRQLVERFPKLRSLAEQSRWAVQACFVDEDYLLDNNAMVVMIPPVSGG